MNGPKSDQDKDYVFFPFGNIKKYKDRFEPSYNFGLDMDKEELEKGDFIFNVQSIDGMTEGDEFIISGQYKD